MRIRIDSAVAAVLGVVSHSQFFYLHALLRGAGVYFNRQKVGTMNRADFKPCAGCRKGVAHTGLPLFWRVEVTRMGIDRQAAMRQHGLEQFFGGGPGGVALADIMGDGAPIAKPVADTTRLLLCESCARDTVRLAVLVECENKRAEAAANRRESAT